MRRTLLVALLCVSCATHPRPARRAAAGPSPDAAGFMLGKFFVRVDPATVTAVPPLPHHTFPSDDALAGRVFGGKGEVTIRGQHVVVEFSGVRLVRSGIRLVAKAGVAKGNGTGAIAYTLDGVDISLTRNTLRLEISRAFAAITAKVPVVVVAANAPPVVLTAVAANLSPDGSVIGSEFSASGSLTPGGTQFAVTLVPGNSHELRIGPAAASGTMLPGAYVKGAVQDGGTAALLVAARVAPAVPEADVTLKLIREVTRTPEDGYEVHLRPGNVVYRYTSGGIAAIEGSLPGTVTLPAGVVDDAGSAVTVEAPFVPDSGAALTARPAITKKLRAAAPFLVEVLGTDSWVYLPNWWTSPPASTYSPKDATCPKLFDIIYGPSAPSTAHRPGLTIFHGIVHFDSPQASTKPDPGGKLKAEFWGDLTATPSGLLGELTTSGNSFIPAREPLANGATRVDSPPSTWQQILDAGDAAPVAPKHRFLLSKFRVLELRADRLRFCMKRPDSPSFRYAVHFPHPSFVDLEFEDQSLDAEGRFHAGAGPILPDPAAVVSTAAPECTDAKPKVCTVPEPVAHGRFLWFWRLPVTFADRGVKLSHDGTPIATVALDTTRVDALGNVFSSEITVPPLFSERSALKAGVRFAGTLAPDGAFALTGWDQAPYFGERFAKRFSATLDASGGIALASAPPAARPKDFEWKGTLLFPYFGSQQAQFEVRNVTPIHVKPVALSQGIRPKLCCSSGAQNCPAAPTQFGVAATGVKYAAASGAFVADPEPIGSATIDVTEVSTATRHYQAQALSISSYTQGLVTLRVTPPQDYEIRPPSTGCSGTTVRQLLQGSQPGSNYLDLVCLDPAATQARGVCTNCDDYRIGTYVVLKKRSCSGCTEEPIVSSPGARFYGTDGPLEIAGRLTLQSDQLDAAGSSAAAARTYSSVLNIPSAQLAFGDGMVEGAFGATLATVATSLPYEGELRFFLDTKCGQFYVLGAGSFTYWARFTAQMLLLHAPLERLQTTPFLLCTETLEDMALRALFRDAAELKQRLHLDEVPPNVVLTGLFTAGGAALSASVWEVGLRVDAGAGAYLFQQATGTPKYRAGTFLNAKASASLYAVGIQGRAQLAMGLMNDSAASLADALSVDRFVVDGALQLGGCATAFVGHCEAGLETNATYASDTGLEVSGVDSYCDCGGGGCDE